MTFNPKVSIIIPVYNGSNYLKEAIDSALAQAYQNTEVIVVNDGSNDEGKTESIAKSYGDKIRYFYKKNGGVASALNYGIRKMNGEYLSWLSHDDVYYPNKVEVQIRYLKSLPNRNVILYSDFDYIDNKSLYIRTEKIVKIEPTNFIYALMTSHPIHGCTALVPKYCLKDMGEFNESLKITQDYDMWFRMALKYSFIHISEILIHSRLHSEQGSILMKKTAWKEINTFLINGLNILSDRNFAFEVGKPKAIFNIEIALNMIKRDFQEASLYAYKMSIKELSGTDQLNALYLTYFIRYWIMVLKRFALGLLPAKSYFLF